MLSTSLVACYDDDGFTPKKRGFYKIYLPKKEYTAFSQAAYPYSFQYPVYSTAVRDSLFFNQKAENPFWLNLDFKGIGGKLHLTYKCINGKDEFRKFVNDAFKMSYAHDKKASYIKEPVFHTKNNVHGIWYNVGGNAASAYQFFATDSNKHFLRGALYFDAVPNADSLSPVNAFLAEDIEHLIQTLTWTK
jgi:gliding motility-associated lipoprotein GldD